MTITKAQLKEIARSVTVTDHSDYRTYLAFVYAQAKQVDPNYSYILMSKDLGVGSTNAHSVIQGRRPLTLKSAEKMCKALGLTKVHKKYFLALVQQQRAKTPDDREKAFEQRLNLKQSVLPTELDKRQLAFFEHWYHTAILEILRLEHAEDSAEWIADQIRPTVSVAEVSESLKLLESLGYIAKDPKVGRLYPTDATITTGNEVLGLAIMSYHRQMLKLAVNAVENVARHERDLSAITVGASPELVRQFKDEIVALRKRFLQLAAEEENAEDVMQINFQLFPLTGGKDKK